MIATVEVHQLRCDHRDPMVTARCATTFTGLLGESIEGVRRRARAAGWRTADMHGLDLCPMHQGGA